MLFFKLMSLLTGMIFGVMICSLLWADAENRNSTLPKKAICYLMSAGFMGCAFLCIARYPETGIETEYLLNFTGLVFLAIYAIQDMIEMAVYTFLLNLGVFGLALVKGIICFAESGFTEFVSFLALSAAVYASLKILSKAFPKCMGSGDYDILFVIYILCGEGTIQAVFISSVIGLCVFVGSLLFKEKKATDRIPLAPILYLGTALYLFC